MSNKLHRCRKCNKRKSCVCKVKYVKSYSQPCNNNCYILTQPCNNQYVECPTSFNVTLSSYCNLYHPCGDCGVCYKKNIPNNYFDASSRSDSKSNSNCRNKKRFKKLK